MPRLGLRAFTAADVPSAGVLLSARHARHREAEPLLAARFEDAATAEAELGRVWLTVGASGSVADVGGRMVGFLLGAPKAGEAWGRNVWVEAAGCAVAEPEAVRDLYGYAAATWVAEGRTAHYALVPSHDRGLVDAWFRLGFGQQHVHAIRAAQRLPSRPPSGVTIRAARREDVPTLAALDVALPQHQVLSPVFSGARPPSPESVEADWAEEIGDPALAVYVAEYEGLVIGSAFGCSAADSSVHAGLSRPDHAALLGFAAVLPAYRGRGVGRALGEAVVHWAAASGYPSVLCDWRGTNLLSSRTWPRLGFRDTWVRLHRNIGY